MSAVRIFALFIVIFLIGLFMIWYSGVDISSRGDKQAAGIVFSLAVSAYLCEKVIKGYEK